MQDYPKQPSVTDADIAAFQKRKVRWYPKSPAILPRLRGSIPRVGYHCSFMNSATMHTQLYPALRLRDRSKAEVIGYAPDFLHPPDTFFDAQWNTRKMSDAEFCERVRKDNIDILIECSGFSPGHRFKALAMRCAPVQVSYLNHPASSHVPNVDYIWADRVALPSWDHYSEKPYFFDSCFFCFNYEAQFTPDVFPPPIIREGYVTFGCFGSITKINPELIDLWADVLKAVPQSRLVLQAEAFGKMKVQNKIRAAFADRGIAHRGLELYPGTSRFETMANYRRIDVALDTWPYCGGNTTAEALWMGVPVVTLKGDRFSSSYGASLVNAAGYPELIAETREQYIEICKSFTREGLENNRGETRKRGILWDAEGFARKLERAYADLLPVSSHPQVAGLGAVDELGYMPTSQVLPPPLDAGTA